MARYRPHFGVMMILVTVGMVIAGSIISGNSPAAAPSVVKQDHPFTPAESAGSFKVPNDLRIDQILHRTDGCPACFHQLRRAAGCGWSNIANIHRLRA